VWPKNKNYWDERQSIKGKKKLKGPSKKPHGTPPKRFMLGWVGRPVRDGKMKHKILVHSSTVSPKYQIIGKFTTIKREKSEEMKKEKVFPIQKKGQDQGVTKEGKGEQLKRAKENCPCTPAQAHPWDRNEKFLLEKGNFTGRIPKKKQICEGAQSAHERDGTKAQEGGGRLRFWEKPAYQESISRKRGKEVNPQWPSAHQNCEKNSSLGKLF